MLSFQTTRQFELSVIQSFSTVPLTSNYGESTEYYLLIFDYSFKLLTKLRLIFRFYINLQVLNNQYFDALNYIRSKSIKEKQILFEYFFDSKFIKHSCNKLVFLLILFLFLGCKETNKLKCLIEYLWELEEEELFYSYLKKFSDPDSLTIQLLFLLQRGR